MDALVVYPENKEQLTAVKAVMKAMKISFEQKSQLYPSHIVSGVKQSLRQADQDQLTPFIGIKSMLNFA